MKRKGGANDDDDDDDDDAGGDDEDGMGDGDSCGSIDIDAGRGDEDEEEDEEPSKTSMFDKLRCDFNLNVGQFKIDKQDLRGDSDLQNKSKAIIRVRAELLLKLNMVFYKLFNFVSHDFRLD